MAEENRVLDHLIRDLKDRTKVFHCLYRLEETFANRQLNSAALVKAVVQILPSGFQYTDRCACRIRYEQVIEATEGFEDTPWQLRSDIRVQGLVVGEIVVAYREEVPLSRGNIFLDEERELLETAAQRLSQTILYRRLRKMFKKWEGIHEDNGEEQPEKWRAIIDTLRRSDRKLFIYISRKMLRNLCISGIFEALTLLTEFDLATQARDQPLDENRPGQKQTMNRYLELSNQVMEIAAQHMDDGQILALIEEWIQKDKTKFLIRAIDSPKSTLQEVIDALDRYRFIEAEGMRLSETLRKGIVVSLIRRFFYDQLEAINVAKQHIEVKDYYGIIHRIIHHESSEGNLGGKSAGLFLASRILTKAAKTNPLLKDIKTPKTWYVTSDALIHFLYYNEMEDVNEQKYRSTKEVRLEYPNLIQIFKNAQFPPKIIAGLRQAIEDFGERPIVVRSSSLLEDRIGAAFSGKYKSLFLANQGTKEERLEALKDAIAEVYASTFGPDPIEYRRERGLLDFFEEMGIMIQEVVGTKVGSYFFPAFAGVAFNNNEFRWSPRIKREDGLLRMAPGLGTRVVDRVASDYPTLIAPGQPKLRVNSTPDETIRYAVKHIDVINLETNQFETIELSELLKTYGDDFPLISKIVSRYQDQMMHQPTSKFNINFTQDELVVTFEGLFAKTPFIAQIRAMLQELKDKIGQPVDIEFAHNGEHLHLLQCRPQSYADDHQPSPIPRDIPQDKVLFTANRYVSNGQVPDLRYVVYVDPDGYNATTQHETLVRIGQAVSQLNQLLPKRRFVLMGPGRWGSRGDIKLGVCVTYSDINNTAMLIEIAKKKGSYTPDLSFGTHFFQDLVEAAIRYLPLYPDESENRFHADFFSTSSNQLAELCPDYADLSGTVKVIDLAKRNGGQGLRILLNAEIDHAVAFLVEAAWT